MAEPIPAPDTPPRLPPPPFERINDFPDGLSPMLVKELRQGLRTQTFVILFLSLQAVLAFLLLIAAPIADTNAPAKAGEAVSAIIFCVYALGILVIQPLRGISAVAGEIKQNTIDLMVLTRLSAWRIVSGKWLSIMSQSALITLAILPYLILRYFFGGMQLFAELALMACLLIVSGALTAFTIGMSSGSALLRGLIVVGGSTFMMGYVLFGLSQQIPYLIEVLSFTRSDQSLTLLAVLAIALYACYFFLEIGTTSIAPASENRATRKRLIGLAVMVGSYLLLHPVGPEPALITALIIAGCMALDLFSEQVKFPSVVCRRFVRLGPFGRVAGRFLYPGWATGALFFFGITLILFLLIYMTTPDPKQFSYAAIGLGTLAFPAALLQIFARKSSNLFSFYSTLLVLCFILICIVFTIHGTASGSQFLWLFSFIPASLLPIVSQTSPSPEQSTALLLSFLIPGIYLLFLLGRALSHLMALSRMESQALADLDDKNS